MTFIVALRHDGIVVIDTLGSHKAPVTRVCTLDHVAKMPGEDPELLNATICNVDNPGHGSIISVCAGRDDTVTALTDVGINEPKDTDQGCALYHRNLPRLP